MIYRTLCGRDRAEVERTLHDERLCLVFFLDEVFDEVDVSVGLVRLISGAQIRGPLVRGHSRNACEVLGSL